MFFRHNNAYLNFQTKFRKKNTKKWKKKKLKKTNLNEKKLNKKIYLAPFPSIIFHCCHHPNNVVTWFNFTIIVLVPTRTSVFELMVLRLCCSLRYSSFFSKFFTERLFYISRRMVSAPSFYIYFSQKIVYFRVTTDKRYFYFLFLVFPRFPKNRLIIFLLFRCWPPLRSPGAIQRANPERVVNSGARGLTSFLWRQDFQAQYISPPFRARSIVVPAKLHLFFQNVFPSGKKIFLTPLKKI